LPRQLAPIADGSADQTSDSLALFTSRSALARRKARLIRRREVNQVLKLFDAFKREEGQTMAEYGVVLAVITIAVFGALALLSGNIVNAVTSGRRLHHLRPERHDLRVGSSHEEPTRLKAAASNAA
jgi:Flp pilus assembly pilin Flp